MFKIATFVGSRFGGWITGETRFRTEEDARAYIEWYKRDERTADASPLARKVVPA